MIKTPKDIVDRIYVILHNNIDIDVFKYDDNTPDDNTEKKEFILLNTLTSYDADMFSDVPVNANVYVRQINGYQNQARLNQLTREALNVLNDDEKLKVSVTQNLADKDGNYTTETSDTSEETLIVRNIQTSNILFDEDRPAFDYVNVKFNVVYDNFKSI